MKHNRKENKSRKITHKTNEAIAGAYERATSLGHAQFTLLQLAVSLISDSQGIFYQAISNSDCGSAAQYVDGVFHQALKKLPAQSPAPNQVRASYSLIKAIRRAQAVQQSRGDTHLAVDQLILGLLEDSQITDLLEEVGVTPAKVKFEVEMLRGKEGKKVESASGGHYISSIKIIWD
ncbi:hypothetical protein J1N35_008604 [Gossypium stocksii]|uniref:Clp R domain-containing protein n=1 Tax=Gossypium stocksii TaxID=47602 RepID=A0A9D3W9E4_9ROSI|nr:hypothetical protein J1N35_008604 [Gossypium stocksii]